MPASTIATDVRGAIKTALVGCTANIYDSVPEAPMATAEEGYRQRQGIGIALSPDARELSRKEREGRIKEAVKVGREIKETANEVNAFQLS